ncbi:MAG: hypothetical protein HC941_31785 [Microcoleus sp. SU_5_3]|nr:hypothetical protein [Microcoleus sp. SU_5_3]
MLCDFSTCPLGAVLGVAGYIWAQVTDSSHTHTFNPIPFIRGGVLDVIGSMGHSEARKDFIARYDEFDQLREYLAPVERQEYQMLRGHMALITEYLNQIESGKRFYAYRWICDQFILMRGAFPSMQQTREHTSTMQFVSPLVDCDRIKFIQDASQAPQTRPLIQDAPRAIIQDTPKTIIADSNPIPNTQSPVTWLRAALRAIAKSLHHVKKKLLPQIFEQFLSLLKKKLQFRLVQLARLFCVIIV